MKSFLIAAALGVFAAPGIGLGQDLGTPDTVKIIGDTLYTGRSTFIELAIINDHPITAINLGLITASLDSGFARFDSLVWLNRLADTTVLNLRLSGPVDDNGLSPDTTVISAFKAGADKNPLQPGDAVIVSVWMTGVRAGRMVIDSGWLPSGGNFVMIPYTVDFSGKMFTPHFVGAQIVVMEGPRIVCGNVDGSIDGSVDLGDLTALIDYLFISFQPPPGLAAANVDGSENRVVDLGDLTALISFLFIDFRSLTCF